MQAPIPYPSIGDHAVIGDRRTAALVAADGTLDWFCLPEYDGEVIFGALLDARTGGFWHLGPAVRWIGNQQYPDGHGPLTTFWEDDGTRLELTDVMAWPADERPGDRRDARVVLRRLRCTTGHARCKLQLFPACNFSPAEAKADGTGRASFEAGSHELRLWFSRPIDVAEAGVDTAFEVHAGEEVWAVLESGVTLEWSVARAREVLAEVQAYWQRFYSRLKVDGPHEKQLRLSGVLVHLLSYAPAGSVVAAPTASLPERIGGDWNADYRFSWVRDSSLALASLALLGNTADSSRYLDWLSGLDSSTAAPLQVVYNVRGQTKLKQHELKDVYGYRGSKPVRLGNHAFRQSQHDALGYLIDCVFIYLHRGGPWKPTYWDLIRRCADFLAGHWDEPDNSIWELAEEKRYLSGQVMSWVGLDRALKIANMTGQQADLDRWAATREKVRDTILNEGWSDRMRAFRQHYDADNLDAAALLIPVMGFLPPDDPRVVSTVDRIVEYLTINDFVYRFDPEQTPGVPQPATPLGEYEGAFLPCTFWLATTFAMMGRTERAERILRKAEELSSPNSLFAEGVDVRSGTFLGNTPLLFSQAEYVRAVRALAHARGEG